MSKKIDYHVVFASSNSKKGHFAEDLTLSLKATDKDGWLSKKNAKYPQVVTFYLVEKVDLVRIEITTLRGLIPKKIEIFGANGQESADPQKLPYESLVKKEFLPGPVKDNAASLVALDRVEFFGIPIKDDPIAFLAEPKAEPVEKLVAKERVRAGGVGIFYNSKSKEKDNSEGKESKEEGKKDPKTVVGYKPTKKNDRISSAFRSGAARSPDPSSVRDGVGEGRVRSPLRNKRLPRSTTPPGSPPRTYRKEVTKTVTTTTTRRDEREEDEYVERGTRNDEEEPAEPATISTGGVLDFINSRLQDDFL